MYINESNINVYKWFMISRNFITVDINIKCYNVNVYELSTTMIIVIVWVVFSWYIHIYVCNSNTVIYVTATGLEPNYLVRKRTLTHLAKLAYLYSAFDCMLLSCYVLVLEWIHILYLPRCQGTTSSKQARNLKFKLLQLNSNPATLSS